MPNDKLVENSIDIAIYREAFEGIETDDGFLKGAITSVLELCDEIGRLNDLTDKLRETLAIRSEHNVQQREALTKAEAFMTNLFAHWGTSLEVYNFHQNGDYEPFDNFIDDYDGFDALDLVRVALGGEDTDANGQ